MAYTYKSVAICWCFRCCLLCLTLLGVSCQVIPAKPDQSYPTGHWLPGDVPRQSSHSAFSGQTVTGYFEHYWVARHWVARSVLTDKSGLSRQEAEVGGLSDAKPLVVAIEGDGRPWRHRYNVAADPTPVSPLLLDWLFSTDHSALYLGRPCYFRQTQIDVPEPPVRITGVALNRHCDAYWYTFGRYSQTVVDSMKEAIQQLVSDQCLILLGHSGGGTLAMLIASQIPQVRAVVTLSGNLNVGAWQQYHDFTPLVGSLDPSDRPTLSPKIMQIHIAADADENVLPLWIDQEARRQQAEIQFWHVPGHQHWHKTWDRLESLLAEVKARTTCQLPEID